MVLKDSQHLSDAHSCQNKLNIKYFWGLAWPGVARHGQVWPGWEQHQQQYLILLMIIIIISIIIIVMIVNILIINISTV